MDSLIAHLRDEKTALQAHTRPSTAESELSNNSTLPNSVTETDDNTEAPWLKQSAEPHVSILPPTLLTSLEGFNLDNIRSIDPRALTSEEFLVRIKVLAESLMTARRELDDVTLQRDELFSKYDDVTLMLRDREQQLAYYEELLALRESAQSRSRQWESAETGSEQLTISEQHQLQDATSAALSGMRSLLEEKNRIIERYREKIDLLQSAAPVKSAADRRAELLLQSLDEGNSEPISVARSMDFIAEAKSDDRLARLREKMESAEVVISDKNRQINTLESTLESELLRRERAELRCADSMQEMDAMRADMLMLVQRLRDSEQRYTHLLMSSAAEAKVETASNTRARKVEAKELVDEKTNEVEDDTEAVPDESAVDTSLVVSPVRPDSTDYQKLQRLVKAREEQLRKHRDVIAKLKADIARMEQQQATALLKASSTASRGKAELPSTEKSGDEVNDLKRQVISLRDNLRETKEDLERSRKAREKLIQLKHTAVEEARRVAGQLTRAEAQAQAYQDTLQRTRGELEDTKKREKRLREKLKEFGADPDVALAAQSSSPRAASIALHKECAMLRTQNAQLRHLIAQAALATDDNDSPGKKRKSTLAGLDGEEGKDDSFSYDKDGDSRLSDGEKKLLKR